MVITSTAGGPCTNGQRCDLTGTCGRRTITTGLEGGSGAGSVALAAISTVFEFFAVGQGANGSPFEVTGISFAATISGTACMVATIGHGEATEGLDTTCTDGESCVGSGTTAGSMCARIGTCGRRIITTSQLAGSGVAQSVCTDTCIACESCGGGMGVSGSPSVRIGI